MIVKVYSYCYSGFYFFNIVENSIFEKFILHRVIDTLRLGILLRVSALCHTDAYQRSICLY